MSIESTPAVPADQTATSDQESAELVREERSSALGALARGPRLLLGQALRRRAQHYAPRNQEDRNILFVTLDGVAIGLTIMASSFLSVFVVRLGASAFWVSLLSSLPALVNMTLALPVSRILERQRRIVPFYAWARLVVFAGYVLVGVLPFFLRPERAAQAIVLFWGAWAVVTTFSSLGFTLVMSQAVRRERRAVMMSSRWTAMGVAEIVILAFVSQVLQRVPFPLNYQLLFLLSFGAAFLAFLMIRQVQQPEREPVAPAATVLAPTSRRARLGGALGEITAARPYMRYLSAIVFFWLGMTAIAPLIPIYWIKQLQASDAYVSYFTTVSAAAGLLSYSIWARLKRRKGDRPVLLVAVFGRALYPLLVSLTTSPGLMLVVAGFDGVAAAGVNLMFFDAFLDTVPKGKEPRFIAVHQTMSYLFAFIAPPLGAALLSQVGIRPTLIGGTVVALVGFLLFMVGGVGRE